MRGRQGVGQRIPAVGVAGEARGCQTGRLEALLAEFGGMTEALAVGNECSGKVLISGAVERRFSVDYFISF